MSVAESYVAASRYYLNVRERFFYPFFDGVFGVLVVVADDYLEVFVVLFFKARETVFEVFLIFEANNSNGNFWCFHRVNVVFLAKFVKNDKIWLFIY